MNPQDLKKVYRFLCLISLVYNGLEEKFYDQIKKEIIETHGLTHIKVFNNLERARFLFKKNKKNKKDKSIYQKLCEPFGLRREFPEDTDPTLINLPYNSYVPLSYKLFEMAIFEAWIKQPELLSSIPGPMEKHGNLENVLSDPSKKKTMMLYMIGGMTYSEASYFRKLAESSNIELKLLSTNMNKSFEVLDSFLEGGRPLF
jgi:Sec1 family